MTGVADHTTPAIWSMGEPWGELHDPKAPPLLDTKARSQVEPLRYEGEPSRTLSLPSDCARAGAKGWGS